MLNEALHTDLIIPKGEFFVKAGQENYRIGKVVTGVLRGFTIDKDGQEITTHFFRENDLVSGNYVPTSPATMNIQAEVDCLLSVANYQEVFLQVNKDTGLTQVILSNFQLLNTQNQARLRALITGDALTKYTWFLQEYPNLLNRVPHYHIASFLGMTPTQLSRTRKTFSQQM